MGDAKPAGSPATPPGRSTVMPYVAVADAQAAIDFAMTVLGATLAEPPLRHRDGSIWNAELRIGDSALLVSQARGFGPHPAFLYVYVEDCDATYIRALEAGAESLMPPGDQFYGDRNAGVRDNAGNIWWIAEWKETLSADELQARALAAEDAKA